MMYSQTNLLAMFPSLSLPSLTPPQIQTNCCNNVTNFLPATAFNPYLLSPPAMPSKSQILAEMEVEYQKLRFLENLLYTSPTGYLLNPTPSLSSALSLSLPSIPQPHPQYPLPPSITPTSSNVPSSTTSTPLSLVESYEIKKIKKSTSHSIIPGSSSSSDRPHQCNECGKRFKFKSNLFEHKSLHSSQQTYQYVCPFCSKSCRLKGNLKKHLQIHMGTADQLEKFWKVRFSRSSGRPRKVISQSSQDATESLKQSFLKDLLLDVTN
uniref:C2H2-type domain-containing protein n=1 Tax=Panagrolaimus sp. ES5 TaxID=591445 RepID=A0AC34F2V9_9BILA